MNLTAQQKSLLIESWKPKDFDFIFHIGMCVYSEIFRLNPSAKKLFPYVVQCEQRNEDITSTYEFRIQALRFVQILGLAVRKVKNIEHDDDDDFDTALFQLGEKHRAFAERGFKPEYWNIFETAVVHVMTNEINNNFPNIKPEDRQTAIDSWSIVCKYIITGMKFGFYQDHLTSKDDKATVNADGTRTRHSAGAQADNDKTCCHCCKMS